MKKYILGALAAAAAACGLLVPVGGGAAQSSPAERAHPLDLSAFSASAPAGPLRLLAIHHSCGGQLLAPPGAEKGDQCVYVSHPNGGGLRPLLEAQGYEVHEASYGSEIGNDTDLFHWLPKFSQKMDRVLEVSRQSEVYGDGRKNQIVVFKSCFPNNEFAGEGSPPGQASGPELTVWNAKATMTAVLGELAKRPETLFVYVTAPATAPRTPKVPAWRWLARRLRGKGTPEHLARQAGWAREFNTWVASTSGWLKDYPAKNVVVFDYYDVLTGHGRSNLSVFASEDGLDSHPTAEGNARAAEEFVPFLNRAVHRAGLGLAPAGEAADVR